MNEWPYFPRHELVCHCGKCDRADMDPEFMERLVWLREDFGPMPLSSAFRCPEWNAKVSSTGANGPHTTGRAVDVVVAGREARRLLALAIAHGFQGIGVSQRGEWRKRFLHLDMLGERIWSY